MSAISALVPSRGWGGIVFPYGTWNSISLTELLVSNLFSILNAGEWLSGCVFIYCVASRSKRHTRSGLRARHRTSTCAM